jgi:hypothetical protein
MISPIVIAVIINRVVCCLFIAGLYGVTYILSFEEFEFLHLISNLQPLISKPYPLYIQLYRSPLLPDIFFNGITNIKGNIFFYF